MGCEVADATDVDCSCDCETDCGPDCEIPCNAECETNGGKASGREMLGAHGVRSWSLGAEVGGLEESWTVRVLLSTVDVWFWTGVVAASSCDIFRAAGEVRGVA